SGASELSQGASSASGFVTIEATGSIPNSPGLLSTAATGSASMRGAATMPRAITEGEAPASAAGRLIIEDDAAADPTLATSAAKMALKTRYMTRTQMIQRPPCHPLINKSVTFGHLRHKGVRDRQRPTARSWNWPRSSRLNRL